MMYIIAGILGFVLANLVILMIATENEKYRNKEVKLWNIYKTEFVKHLTLIIILPIMEVMTLLFENPKELQIIVFVLAMFVDVAVVKKAKLKK